MGREGSSIATLSERSQIPQIARKGENAKGHWGSGAEFQKKSAHQCKPCSHRCKPLSRQRKRLFPHSRTRGPNDLSHSLLTTLGQIRAKFWGFDSSPCPPNGVASPPDAMERWGALQRAVRARPTSEGLNFQGATERRSAERFR